VDYAQNSTPLLLLLQMGERWKWTGELLVAYERLWQQFSMTIRLMHPIEGQDFSIYADASKNAMGAVLIQSDEHGETCVISTASRVLTPTERKYSICEHEILAIVYALQKFRIYVSGHHIKVRTDNKALPFFKEMYPYLKQNLMWIMVLQVYDI
jgi:hypothetical protein